MKNGDRAPRRASEGSARSAGQLPAASDAAAELWIGLRLAPVPVAILQLPGGGFVEANEQFCSLLEVDRGQIVSRTIGDLGLWESEANRGAILDAFRRDGRLQNIAARMRTPSGALRDLLVSAGPLVVGGRQFIVISVFDVTEADRAREEAAAAQARLREQARLVDLAPVIVRDPETAKITLWSAGAERVYGWTAEDVIGRRGIDFGLATVNPDLLDRIRAIVDGRGTWEGELERRREDGAPVITASRFVRLDDAAGGPLAIVETFADVTAARRTKRLLADLVAHAPIGLAILDREASILEINPTGLAMLEASDSEELRGRDARQFIVGDSIAATLATLERTLAGELSVVECELRGLRGRRFWCEAHAVPYRPGGSEVQGLISMFRDVTVERSARDDADRALLSANAAREDLLRLARRLSELQDEQRRRLAIELHDEIGQLLAGARLLLARSRPTGLVARADEIIGEAIGRVRSLSLHLRPPLLDELGLVPAVRALVERMNGQGAVEVSFLARGRRHRYEQTVETAAYRVIQEALRNAVQHSGAERASVEIQLGPQGIALTVKDAGRGFDLAAALRQGTSTGLVGLRERVGWAGGQVRIESTPGEGTTIRASIPGDPVEKGGA